VRLSKNSNSEFFEKLAFMPVQQPSGQGAELSPDVMQDLSRLAEVASLAKGGNDPNSANEFMRMMNKLYAEVQEGQAQAQQQLPQQEQPQQQEQVPAEEDV
jgi:hypothetical protein